MPFDPALPKPPSRHPCRAALGSVPSPKPRCLHEMLQRVEQGTTTKDDADYLVEVLNICSARIGALQMQVALLQRRVAPLQ